MGHLEKSPKAQLQASNHYQWHKTFTSEKERYMTCKGETAAYREKNINKDLGEKRSTKYSIGKNIRECNRDYTNFSPGPGFYNTHVRTDQKDSKVGNFGSFGKSSRLFNVTKMDR